MGTPTKNYGLPQWDGNEYFKRTAMNEGFTKVDEALKKVEDGAGAVVEEALKSFDRLSMQPGHRTTDTLTRPDILDVWTSVITDAGGRELARKVDKEERQLNGRAQWTTTITIGDKTVTVTEKETATGWVREVK